MAHFPRPGRAVLGALLLSAVFVITAAPAFAATVRLTDSGFDPSELTVPAGETVVWTNATETRQTIVGTDGTWDSGPLGPGETFSVQLRQPGTIGFRTEDGSATGSVRVSAAAAEEPAAETPVIDPAEPALPRTGLPILSIAGLGAGLVLAGAFAVHRANT